VLIARRTDGECRSQALARARATNYFWRCGWRFWSRRTSELIPFIGDDLLASFDDDHTLATLRLLAAAGKQRQIILFSHHRHVANLAQSVQDHMVGGVHL
jgi:chromosome segregation protein